MGHAGALISGGADTADAKLAIMEECGFKITRNPPRNGPFVEVAAVICPRSVGLIQTGRMSSGTIRPLFVGIAGNLFWKNYWPPISGFAVGQIILIDILLGGDNAVVIALARRQLPTICANRAFCGYGCRHRLAGDLIAFWCCRC